MRQTELLAALDQELRIYREARRAGDIARGWIALERAHVLSQPFLIPHLRVHGLMLGLAVHGKDVRESFGQVFRLALVPLGALTGRVPRGNTGRSRVSPFRTMPVPQDLRRLLG